MGWLNNMMGGIRGGNARGGLNNNAPGYYDNHGNYHEKPNNRRIKNPPGYYDHNGNYHENGYRNRNRGRYYDDDRGFPLLGAIEAFGSFISSGRRDGYGSSDEDPRENSYAAERRRRDERARREDAPQEANRESASSGFDGKQVSEISAYVKKLNEDAKKFNQAGFDEKDNDKSAKFWAEANVRFGELFQIAKDIQALPDVPGANELKTAVEPLENSLARFEQGKATQGSVYHSKEFQEGMKKGAEYGKAHKLDVQAPDRGGEVETSRDEKPSRYNYDGVYYEKQYPASPDDRASRDSRDYENPKNARRAAQQVSSQFKKRLEDCGFVFIGEDSDVNAPSSYRSSSNREGGRHKPSREG